ncbi:FecR family protein [Iodobacter fluviatilis]|uniref:Fec operon regulator FecR n=1 Tax=Iodobacter fluviatilis TaxID=537 RepID=A0A377Q3X3_9NEIS|nr:FecR family protein [Iodobacter fluviatilis]TCU90490.1 FecR family protein [Iodobacter fluviatilis]STQ89517.1 fec operon regulator FecR [Iodobacter fluviatilis]
MSSSTEMTQIDPDTAAAQWLLRQEQGLCPAEKLHFKEWLSSHPAHQQAWQDMQNIDRLISEMPPSCSQHFAKQRKQLAAKARRERYKQLISAYFTPRLLAGCALSVLACSYWWLSLPSYQQQVQTARGQMLEQYLPDGSHVELDTDSQLEIALYRDKREVRLIKGQAMFHVSKGRPFHVITDQAKVSVLGTQFSVRNTQKQIQVAVQSGKVAVQPKPAALPGLILHAGEVVTLANNALSPVQSIAPAAVGSWRHGRLNFDNTTLANAIAEFERYTPTGLRISDPDIGGLRISGSFEIKKLQQFTQALPQVLPVKINNGEISAP